MGYVGPASTVSVMATHLKSDKPLHILDAGVGSGLVSVDLKIAFPDAVVDGTDYSAKMLTIAESRGY